MRTSAMLLSLASFAAVTQCAVGYSRSYSLSQTPVPSLPIRRSYSTHWRSDGSRVPCPLHAYSDFTLTNSKEKKSSPKSRQSNRRANNIAQKMILLVEKMINSRSSPGSIEFQFDATQIDDKIKQYKIDLSVSSSVTGTLLLRAAITACRRDVCRILLKHGALPLAVDSEGFVFYEALLSDKAGSLHMMTELLEGISPEEVKNILKEKLPDLSRASKKYWLGRGLKHVFPNKKLVELGLARLNALKYKIVGQSFALEQILGEVSSHHINTELSDKPLVLLFSGPPGHGKTEMAKQLADLLSCPFHKVDCRNHANPWEMFGSGVGYVGSEGGTQLSNFIQDNEGVPSVVLLDEFDHCDSETWEAFYHVFDEGIFTHKKSSGAGTTSATKQIKCSRTLWLLTTNKFDDDIHVFNDKHIKTIKAYQEGKVPFNDLHESFDSYIRPKLRAFFQGGLTRRIDAVVPFFKFDKEEAYVVADMYIDSVREMYARPKSAGRFIGDFDFAVTDHAVGEVSKGYALHQLDGATAVKRDIKKKMIKDIHMQWMRSEGAFSTNSNNRDGTVWIHYTDLHGYHQVGALSDEQRKKSPYFVENFDGNERKSGGYLREFGDVSGSQIDNMKGSKGEKRGSGVRTSQLTANEAMEIEWNMIDDADNENEDDPEIEDDRREKGIEEKEGENEKIISVSVEVENRYKNKNKENTNEGTKNNLNSNSIVKEIYSNQIYEEKIEDWTESVGLRETDQLESDIKSPKLLNGDNLNADLSNTLKTGLFELTENSRIAENEEMSESKGNVESEINQESEKENKKEKNKKSFQHINLFFFGSNENLIAKKFFSHNNIDNRANIGEIRDLLCKSLGQSVNPLSVRCWIKDRGVAGNSRGRGVLAVSTESASSLPLVSLASDSLDDQFEMASRGRTDGKTDTWTNAGVGTGTGTGLGLRVNPFGPEGTMLSMERTDVVNGWRFLRPDMYSTSLQDMVNPLSSSSSSTSSFSLSNTEEDEEEEMADDTLDLLFEIGERDEKYASQPSLESWRSNLKVGDVLDVLFKENPQGPVWVEGRVRAVGAKGYGYGYVEIKVELLIGATEEFLKKYDMKSGKIFVVLTSASLDLQPLYSQSRNWREEVLAGDTVYGALRQGVWMAATVCSHDDENMEEGEAEEEGENEGERKGESVDTFTVRFSQHNLDITKKFGRDNISKAPAKSSAEIAVTDVSKRKTDLADISRSSDKAGSPIYKTVSKYSDQISHMMVDILPVVNIAPPVNAVSIPTQQIPAEKEFMEGNLPTEDVTVDIDMGQYDPYEDDDY